MRILHVTNGDHAAEGLVRSGLPGDVLPWRDVLHDGAVPPDDDRDAFRRTRARFLTERPTGTSEEAVMVDFVSRDARLDAMTANDAIVLWFEPDLYDQLQLVQVLSRLEQRAPDQRPHVSIVPADVMLGPLEPRAFLPLHEARRGIIDEDLVHGRAAWRAFTSATPDALVDMVAQLDREIMTRSYASDDTTRLPHLTLALHRMLEEYPNAKTGLSRTERHICEKLAPGPMTLSKLFPAAHHASEAWPWLGDWSFAWYVQRISDVAHPLVTQENGARVPALDAADETTAFWHGTVMLTPFGRDVVEARADALEANGIDRWIGGAHLTTARHWRWDAAQQRTVARP